MGLILPLFLACDGMDSDILQGSVGDFFTEYTNTASIERYALSKGASTDAVGNLYIPSDEDVSLILTLRNPQKYNLEIKYHLNSDAHAAPVLGTDYTVEPNTNRNVYKVTFKSNFLRDFDGKKANPTGDMSGYFTVYNPSTASDFASFPLIFRVNSAPVKFSDAAFQMTTEQVLEAEEIEETGAEPTKYVLCFQIPDLATADKGVHSEDLKHVQISEPIYGSGSTANARFHDYYFKTSGSSISWYTDENCTELATDLLSDRTKLSTGDCYHLPKDPSIEEDPYVFIDKPDFYSAYLETGIIYTDQRITYVLRTVDDAGLVTETKISNSSLKLAPPVIKHANGNELSSGERLSASSETGEKGVILTHNGSTTNGGSVADTGAIDIYYVVTRDGSIYKKETVKSGTTVYLPAGKSVSITASATDGTNIGSADTIAENLRIFHGQDFYVSGDTGSDTDVHSLGTKDNPYATIQKCIDIINDEHEYTDERDEGYIINLLSDITAPSSSFADNGNAYVNIAPEADLKFTIQGIADNGQPAVRTINASRSTSSTEHAIHISASRGGTPDVTLRNLTITNGNVHTDVDVTISQDINADFYLAKNGTEQSYLVFNRNDKVTGQSSVVTDTTPGRITTGYGDSDTTTPPATLFKRPGSVYSLKDGEVYVEPSQLSDPILTLADGTALEATTYITDINDGVLKVKLGHPGTTVDGGTFDTSNLDLNWTIYKDTKQVSSGTGVIGKVIEVPAGKDIKVSAIAKDTTGISQNSGYTMVQGITVTHNIEMYVSSSGSDTDGKGSKNSPYSSIQKAIDVIDEEAGWNNAGYKETGYTIKLLSDVSADSSSFAGNGNAFVNIGSQMKVTVEGAKADNSKAVINANRTVANTGAVIYLGGNGDTPDVTLKNLTIKGGYVNVSTMGAAITANNANLSLDHVTITTNRSDVTDDDDGMRSIVFSQGDSVINMKDVTISDNTSGTSIIYIEGMNAEDSVFDTIKLTDNITEVGILSTGDIPVSGVITIDDDDKVNLYTDPDEPDWNTKFIIKGSLTGSSIAVKRDFEPEVAITSGWNKYSNPAPSAVFHRANGVFKLKNGEVQIAQDGLTMPTIKLGGSDLAGNASYTADASTGEVEVTLSHDGRTANGGLAGTDLVLEYELTEGNAYIRSDSVTSGKTIQLPVGKNMTLKVTATDGNNTDSDPVVISGITVVKPELEEPVIKLDDSDFTSGSYTADAESGAKAVTVTAPTKTADGQTVSSTLQYSLDGTTYQTVPANGTIQLPVGKNMTLTVKAEAGDYAESSTTSISGITVEHNSVMYVSSSGSNDSGNGSKAQPFSTVQKAVDIINDEAGWNSGTYRTEGYTINLLSDLSCNESQVDVESETLILINKPMKLTIQGVDSNGQPAVRTIDGNLVNSQYGEPYVMGIFNGAKGTPDVTLKNLKLTGSCENGPSLKTTIDVSLAGTFNSYIYLQQDGSEMPKLKFTEALSSDSHIIIDTDDMGRTFTSGYASTGLTSPSTVFAHMNTEQYGVEVSSGELVFNSKASGSSSIVQRPKVTLVAPEAVNFNTLAAKTWTITAKDEAGKAISDASMKWEIKLLCSGVEVIGTQATTGDSGQFSYNPETKSVPADIYTLMVRLEYKGYVYSTSIEVLGTEQALEGAGGQMS